MTVLAGLLDDLDLSDQELAEAMREATARTSRDGVGPLTAGMADFLARTTPRGRSKATARKVERVLSDRVHAEQLTAQHEAVRAAAGSGVLRSGGLIGGWCLRVGRLRHRVPLRSWADRRAAGAATIATCLRYHSETVALRAGETTVQDLDLATEQTEPAKLTLLLQRMMHRASDKPGKAPGKAEESEG